MKPQHPQIPLEQLTVSAYTVPTDAPEADGTSTWDTTKVVVVEARSGTTYGIGWTYAPLSAGALAEEQLAPAVLGSDVLDIAALHEAMCCAVRPVGRAGIASCAISAVDLALWDLKARVLGLPLVRLLGAARTSVPVYGSGGFTTYHDSHLASQLNGWVHGQSIPRVKIKIGEFRGRSVPRDLERVRLARDVVGRHAELYVDASGGYHRKQAVRVGRELAAQGVGWFEQPVDPDDLAGLRLVRDAVTCDVAAGAHVYGLPQFARLVSGGAVDCLQIDATRCGGLTEFLRVAVVAQAHGLEVSATGAPHAHVHGAAAVPNLRHLEWFHDHARVESMFFDGVLDPTGGTVTPGDSPGNGLSLRHDAVEPYRIA
ncbi:enolase C-terminal domain-like protein [Streptomyces beijiangensis]|uniref:Mandelate racemase n=1 Tax=Streptomyces beijiangensis TaxID=163361 RepID=A0A939F844_9ACTN|nr:enolase C-terminal domain-like protein [Streptomyces beijiangensis]MBO0512190.1 mandelate racemase [Streptomyces beijiangensis]